MNGLTLSSKEFGEHLMNCRICSEKYRKIIDHIVNRRGKNE